ncbi:uncharacterized protein VTP21DRAFT_3437 [Calcarisporiella thermophila]|uniref:uncharacterized protein n=1 Tax=Calcarisporiella thermophila TaxID=911321 RepID=UPI003744901D
MQASTRDKRASTARLNFSASAGDPVVQELEAAHKHLKDFAKWSQEDSDNVLSYFKERIEIEENYIKSLERLVTKQSELDASRKSLDNKARCTTYYQAWSYLYQTTDGLASRRRQFVASLSEIDRKLRDMLERHDQMRTRSKDALKNITSQYLDMRVSTVPKLKRSYEAKCRELEQALHAQAQASNFDTPLRGRGDSQSAGSELRDKTYTTSLADDSQPHKEPKALEKFMSMFANPNADLLKASKTRKEIEENENEYRKAVVELETLREEQISTMNWASQMVNLMLKEKTSYLKKIFGRYVNLEQTLLQAIDETVGQFRIAIDCVNPELDAEIYMDALKGVTMYRIPKVFYENYYVGPCKDIIFGIPLTAYARTRKRNVPLLVQKCIQFIDERGLSTKGLYRVSARQNLIIKLRYAFEKDEEGTVFGQNGITDDLPAIAGLLKSYFRELPEPLFLFTVQDRKEYSRIGDESLRLTILKSRLRTLPDCLLETLHVLVKHLARVVEHQDVNKMTLSNLSLIFTPVIFHDHNQSDAPSQPKATGMSGLDWFDDCVLSDLICYADEVFEVLPHLAARNNSMTSLTSAVTITAAGPEGNPLESTSTHAGIVDDLIKGELSGANGKRISYASITDSPSAIAPIVVRLENSVPMAPPVDEMNLPPPPPLPIHFSLPSSLEYPMDIPPRPSTPTPEHSMLPELNATKAKDPRAPGQPPRESSL